MNHEYPHEYPDYIDYILRYESYKHTQTVATELYLAECVSEGLSEVSTSLYSISDAIVKGIGDVSDQMRVSQLTSEYFTVTKALTDLKRNNPNVNIAIDNDYLRKNIIHIENEKVAIVLAWLFTNLPSSFKRFCQEIDFSDSIDEWILSFFCRAFYDKADYRISYNSAAKMSFNGEETTFPQLPVDPFSRWFSEVEDRSYIKFNEKKYCALLDGFYSKFNPDEHQNKVRYYSICDGVNKLNSWIKLHNFQFLIQYLRQLYNEAFISMINDKKE